MAFEPHPWFIGLEGVEHSAEVARNLAWSATGGGSGIITINDLKVVAQTVPSDSVVIRPGGFVVESKYAGASQQSYVERAPTSTTLEVPATGSSGGATRYVVARVTDPDYPGGGTVPSVPNDGVYAAPYLVSSLSSSRTEIPLAKINQPANTSAITNAMITDLREMANPRVKIVNRARPSVTSDTGMKLNSTTGEYFPGDGDATGARQEIDVPKWATRMIVEASWLSVMYEGGKNSYGRFWIGYGGTPNTYQTQTFYFNSPGTAADGMRANWLLSDYRYVPPEVRGKNCYFSFMAMREPASSGRPEMNSQSGLSLKVTFLEEPDPSTE